jgi:hypothetical protein
MLGVQRKYVQKKNLEYIQACDDLYQQAKSASSSGKKRRLFGSNKNLVKKFYNSITDQELLVLQAIDYYL